MVKQIKQIERSALDHAAFNQAASHREQLLIWSGIALAVAAVRRISASNLHEHLALPGPDDEPKELGDTLDDLFARLEAAFDAQRRFVANASHELRTPITRERALLQVTRANPARTLGASRARDDGHGLGLSIVRAIAAAHGAAITAQPVPGGGLAVAVSFPSARRCHPAHSGLQPAARRRYSGASWEYGRHEGSRRAGECGISSA